MISETQTAGGRKNHYLSCDYEGQRQNGYWVKIIFIIFCSLALINWGNFSEFPYRSENAIIDALAY